MSAIVDSYICATLRAVSKPCQYSIPADYLLCTCHAPAAYHYGISEAFTWYWTYIKIATRMTEEKEQHREAPSTNKRLIRPEMRSRNDSLPVCRLVEGGCGQGTSMVVQGVTATPLTKLYGRL